MPTRRDLLKGSIWRDFEFEARINHIIKPETPDTNHRLLSEKRVNEVSNMLSNRDRRNDVAKLVLRPIGYIVYDKKPDGKVLKEVEPFPIDGAAREFIRVYESYASTSRHGNTASKMKWLEECIIWKSVDGQP